MALLFDILGPEHRHPLLTEAVRRLAENDEVGRGAVFTKRAVVDALLNLLEYTPAQSLYQMRLLEPSFGNGDFLLPAIGRLLDAYQADGGTPDSAVQDLSQSIRAVELHELTFEDTSNRIMDRLREWGMSDSDAAQLVGTWLIHDDFLLAYFEEGFDVVVGNPPYVRQERIPDALLSEYRRRYLTLFDRADLYVPFFERGLDLLKPGGGLGFICANRWLKNKYGGPLREKIARGFHVAFYIDMEKADAFHSDVIAYPAITVIRRPIDRNNPLPTRVLAGKDIEVQLLPRIADGMVTFEPSQGNQVIEVVGVASGKDPWLMDNPTQLPLLRRLEKELPRLEETGCKVGIGVATGVDHVFIGKYDELPVEESRKLPLVMAPDLENGEILWRGHGVVNPFESDGRLAELGDYPKFRAFIERNREAVARRHVAKKNPNSWYRTIDRIYPEICFKQKLLIPDIKGTATVVRDPGQFYPHHNLYFVTSSDWDLEALQAVLRSSVSIMFVAAYCIRMAGGFLRFQAQYLRRIRIPLWENVGATLRERLVDVATEKNLETVDNVVFDLFGLSPPDRLIVSKIAKEAQVQPKGREQ
ncbi:MAG: Eco57I restriction-modification methylase domain-containing protein [Thermoanaerobaculales bacterium]|nr:Eco57I restriction-modification methylase domain-containing protein [Thermoanaerobaculales bacterium]